MVFVQRRGLFKKAAKDDQACAFELLASLAGKLLQESENSSASSNASEGNHQPSYSLGVVEQKRQDEVKPLMMEGISRTEVESQIANEKCHVRVNNDAVLEQTSVNNSSDCWEKIEADVKSEICKGENNFGHYSGRLVEAPQDFRDSCDGNINGFRREQEAGSSGVEGFPLADKCSLKDPLELCINSLALIDANNNVKSPFCRGSFPDASFSRHGNDTKLDFRDDDENFLRCNKISTKSNLYRSPQRIAHRRIRKLLTSKYWKASPKLKDCELSGSGKVDYNLSATNFFIMHVM